jgi:hypothetical protein
MKKTTAELRLSHLTKSKFFRRTFVARTSNFYSTRCHTRAMTVTMMSHIMRFTFHSYGCTGTCRERQQNSSFTAGPSAYVMWLVR